MTSDRDRHYRAWIVTIALLAIVVSSTLGQSPRFTAAQLAVERSFPDYYLEHRKHFQTKVIRIGSHPVWVFRNLGGWAVNSILVEGLDGLIVYDVGVTREHGELIRDEIRKISDKPVTAIIYSHHHGDHIRGTDAIVSREDVEDGRTKIYAWHNFAREHEDESRVVGPVMGLRAVYMFGSRLGAEENVYQGCCGDKFIGGTNGHIPPNHFLSEKTQLVLAGVPMIVFPTGGEAASEIGLYLPDMKIGVIADEVYPALANLYTIRGAKFRDARRWADASRKMLEYDMEWLLGTHMEPIQGMDKIRAVLTTYGDATQYCHDQAVRYMLKGFTPAELQAKFTKLPDYLDVVPYTRPMYGTPQFNTAQQYIGYLGLFQGDAVQFQQTPPVEKAGRLVKLMGGRERVLDEAFQSFADDDPQWAAELVTYLIRIDKGDMDARKLKAAAFRKLGYAEINPQWRNWYLTAALELEGKLDLRRLADRIADQRGGDAVATYSLLDVLRYKVDAEKAGDATININIRVTDSRERDFHLQLRNSVLRVFRGHRAPSDARIELTRSELSAITLGRRQFQSSFQQGRVSVQGDQEQARQFFDNLDLEINTVHLTLR